MNNMENLVIALSVVCVVALIVGVALPFLQRKGIDTGAALERAKSAAEALSGAYGLVRPFLKDSEVIDKIQEYALIAVYNAEQLHKIGELPAEERKDSARGYVKDTLKLIGVDVTPELDAVIDGAIESEVYALGQTK